MPHVESLVDATVKGRFAEPPCFTTRSIGPWKPSLATPVRLPGSRWSTLMRLGRWLALLHFLPSRSRLLPGLFENFFRFPLRFPRSEEGRNDGGGEWDARARNQLISMALMCMEGFSLMQELLIHVNRSSIDP